MNPLNEYNVSPFSNTGLFMFRELESYFRYHNVCGWMDVCVCVCVCERALTVFSVQSGPTAAVSCVPSRWCVTQKGIAQ
jgi:hypothetical protein